VKELGFVGAHWYPHWFAMPPDAARMYTYYAKCCELDIPIMMQVGQNLVYSRSTRLPSVGRPIALATVNPRLSPKEAAEICGDSEARVLFVDQAPRGAMRNWRITARAAWPGSRSPGS